MAESASSQVSSARACIARITSAPSANWVVSPRSAVNPSVPMKASRTLKSAIARSAPDPTSDSDSAWKWPPVSSSRSAGLSLAAAKASVELVTTCTPERPVRCRMRPAVVVPASTMIVSLSATSPAAALAIRSFSVARWRCRSSTVWKLLACAPPWVRASSPRPSSSRRLARTVTSDTPRSRDSADTERLPSRASRSRM